MNIFGWLWVNFSIVLLRHATVDAAWSRINGLMESDGDFSIWSNKEVPYYLDSTYSPLEQAQIRAAIWRVSSDLHSCIRFVEVTPDSEVHKVKITPLNTDNSLETRCYTTPGRLKVSRSENGSTTTEQKLVLARGPDGCLDKGAHSLMKYITITLGKSTEHQKANRDQYIEVNRDNIQSDMHVAYEIIPAEQVFSGCGDYDYCSITHNQVDDYAVNGNKVFKVKQAPYFIPKLSHLSECDCKDLLTMYGCDSWLCAKKDCRLVNSTTSTPAEKKLDAAVSVTSNSTNRVTAPSDNAVGVVEMVNQAKAKSLLLLKQESPESFNDQPNVSSDDRLPEKGPQSNTLGASAANGPDQTIYQSVLSGAATGAPPVQPAANPFNPLDDPPDEIPVPPGDLGASPNTAPALGNGAKGEVNSSSSSPSIVGPALATSSQVCYTIPAGIEEKSIFRKLKALQRRAKRQTLGLAGKSSCVIVILPPDLPNNPNLPSAPGLGFAPGSAQNPVNPNSKSRNLGIAEAFKRPRIPSNPISHGKRGSSLLDAHVNGRVASKSKNHLRTINKEVAFVKWPGNTVPFYLDEGYTVMEEAQIRASFVKLSLDLAGCVQFVETSRDAKLFKVRVTPTPPPFGIKSCHSFPGAAVQYIGTANNEQPMHLIRGPGGCFDGTINSLMKFGAIVLGKRNEHQRTDRDLFITLNTSNILPEKLPAYEKYVESDATNICPYDYCSVTHNKIGEFAKDEARPAFVVNRPPYYVPRLSRLSECDCKELSAIYACRPDYCKPLDCAAELSTSAANSPSPLRPTQRPLTMAPPTLPPPPLPADFQLPQTGIDSFPDSDTLPVPPSPTALPRPPATPGLPAIPAPPSPTLNPAATDDIQPNPTRPIPTRPPVRPPPFLEANVNNDILQPRGPNRTTISPRQPPLLGGGGGPSPNVAPGSQPVNLNAEAAKTTLLVLPNSIAFITGHKGAQNHLKVCYDVPATGGKVILDATPGVQVTLIPGSTKPLVVHTQNCTEIVQLDSGNPEEAPPPNTGNDIVDVWAGSGDEANPVNGNQGVTEAPALGAITTARLPVNPPGLGDGQSTSPPNNSLPQSAGGGPQNESSQTKGPLLNATTLPSITTLSLNSVNSTESQQQPTDFSIKPTVPAGLNTTDQGNSTQESPLSSATSIAVRASTIPTGNDTVAPSSSKDITSSTSASQNFSFRF